MDETKKNEFNSYLAKVNDMYLPMITRQMENNHIEFGDYAKKCVMNAIGTINQLLDKTGISFSSPDLDQSNITNILLNVAYLELNSIAQPSECYFQIRNVKKADNSYKKMIEFGVQADGFDAILSRFGRNVQKVYPFWLVREDDEFEYPSYYGLEYTPPKWKPTGSGKVVRVVYPILHTDNTLHFYIGERADVLKNLLAHINNNLMNEAFGIVQNRYKANAEQLAEINAKKAELKNRAKKLGFDALDDEVLAPYISPSWKEDFSREAMIIRKIRNNIVKKIPKDFGSPAVYESFNEATDEGYSNTKRAIEENNAVISIDPIEPESVDMSTEIDDYPNAGSDSGERGKASTGKVAASGGADVDARRKPKFD